MPSELQWVVGAAIAIPAAVLAGFQIFQATSAKRRWEHWNDISAGYEHGTPLWLYAASVRDQQLLKLATSRETRGGRFLQIVFGSYAILSTLGILTLIAVGSVSGSTIWTLGVLAAIGYGALLAHAVWTSVTRARIADRLEIPDDFRFLQRDPNDRHLKALLKRFPPPRASWDPDSVSTPIPEELDKRPDGPR